MGGNLEEIEYIDSKLREVSGELGNIKKEWFSAVEEANVQELGNIVDRLREVNTDIQSVISSTEKMKSSGVMAPPEYMAEPLLVCWQVEKEGGEVSKERLREIAREYGQSGVLGSYFVGEEPLLTKVDISRRALTSKGKKLVEGYQDWLDKQDSAT
ncbi:MAG: hypothetical protein ACOC5L_02205 [Halobacteriota archaeon]